MDASIFLDFSKSHDFQIVRDTGVIIQDFPGDKGYYIIHAKALRIRLPGGNELSQNVRSLTVSVNKFGKIENIDFYGPGLPTDVAYVVAKKIHEVYTIPQEQLKGWFEKNKNLGWNGLTFSNTSRACYPTIFLEINSAVNLLFPWKISTEISWGTFGKEEQGRDEKWGELHNPRLPEGMAALSLDPPDGRIYDPMDAYKHPAGRQEALDKKLGQIRGPDGRLIRVERLENREPKTNPPAPHKKKQDRGFPIAAMALIAICILIAVVAWYLFKCRKDVDRM